MSTWLRALLRFAFQRLYNELAWAYDLVSAVVSVGQWRAWQRAGLSRLRGRRVLDAAHGTGDMLIDLAALGFRPVGLDLSPAMGRQARRKLARHGLAVPLARGRVQALPFASSSFPSVLAAFPTDFILDPGALAELARVLEPGGALVVVPAAEIIGPAWADRLAAWLFRATGQAPADEALRPLLAGCAAAGLPARLERVPLARSRVALVLAEKPWPARV